MTEAKPFNLIVSLVKTQIRAEKRLKRNGLERCSGALGLLMDKYDWIASPGFSPEEQKPAQEYAPGTPNKPFSRSAARGAGPAGDPPPRLPRFAQQHLGQETVLGEPQRVIAATPAPRKPQDPSPAARAQLSESRAPETPKPMMLPDGWDEKETSDLVACPYCSRKFAPDRVEKHQSVCPQNPAKKRRAEKRGTMDMTSKRLGAALGSSEK